MSKTVNYGQFFAVFITLTQTCTSMYIGVLICPRS